MNYYNENDAGAAQWLRNLIDRRLIPAGHVDARSIKEVQADDLKGFTQCHFFAGIAGWSLALQIAGWPEDVSVWTGSCPCQPFSAAGKRKGKADERHLWPDFQRLIGECGPAIVFGEQVASKDGREWLAGVRADLEALGYAVGAADLCAASQAAPHIRQRLWWVADAAGKRCRPSPITGGDIASEETGRLVEPGRHGPTCGMGNTSREGLARRSRQSRNDEPQQPAAQRAGCNALRLADSNGGESSDGSIQRSGQHGFWSQNATAVLCTDGKTRRIPTEPEFQPVAHGVSGRMGKLRGYGNAINPWVAAEFIQAFSGIYPGL